jgi:hypothetical protein
MLGKIKSFVIILGAVLALGTAGAASADNWCAHHVAHEEHQLDKAIERHGVYSRQAEHERRELARLREECRFRGGDRYR